MDTVPSVYDIENLKLPLFRVETNIELRILSNRLKKHFSIRYTDVIGYAALQLHEGKVDVQELLCTVTNICTS